MPKKFGENTKKAAGNAKVLLIQIIDVDDKKAAANEARIAKLKEQEERKEQEEWSKGAKSTSKAEAEEEKRKAQAARKAEKAALEAAERASLPSKPAKPTRGEDKKAIKSGNLDDLSTTSTGPALTASNIDDALDALTLTTGGEAEERKAVAGIDRHPERRQKAALAAFEDKRLPKLKQERPGLRLQQYKDLIYKEFQKVFLTIYDELIVVT